MTVRPQADARPSSLSSRSSHSAPTPSRSRPFRQPGCSTSSWYRRLSGGVSVCQSAARLAAKVLNGEGHMQKRFVGFLDGRARRGRSGSSDGAGTIWRPYGCRHRCEWRRVARSNRHRDQQDHGRDADAGDVRGWVVQRARSRSRPLHRGRRALGIREAPVGRRRRRASARRSRSTRSSKSATCPKSSRSRPKRARRSTCGARWFRTTSRPRRSIGCRRAAASSRSR